MDQSHVTTAPAQVDPSERENSSPREGEPDQLYVDLARQFVRQNWGMGHKGPVEQAGKFVRGEAATLGYLANVSDEVTPGDLAHEFAISTARVASLLNGLERKGFIAREQSSEDRRKVIVSITDEGRDVLREKHDQGIHRLATMLEALGEHDARELVRISARVRDICKDDEGAPFPAAPGFDERGE